MDADKLSEARQDNIHLLIREIQLFSRRKKPLLPEERVALAEIEHELMEIEKRWERLGLINGQEELPLAAEAPDKR